MLHLLRRRGGAHDHAAGDAVTAVHLRARPRPQREDSARRHRVEPTDEVLAVESVRGLDPRLEGNVAFRKLLL